jgi:hypothetical protein
MANKKFLNPINLVNLSSDPSTASEGDIYYNTTSDAVKVYANGAWIAIGSGDGASTSSVYLVRNNTGSTILKGTLVSASGAEPSGRIDVEPFAAVGGINSELTVMGMATTNISNGVNGEVISFGTLTGIDTRGDTSSAIAVGDETWAAGDILFAHPTVAGKLTKVRPQHDLAVAFITVRHASTGQIAVRIVPGNNHLEWMHDVLIDTPADNEVLSYDSASGLWKNQTPVEAGLLDTSSTAQTKSGDLTIGGNLTVNGTTTTIDTENLLIKDNIITLNSSVTGTPTGTAGIEVERGTEANTSILWDESTQTWKFENDIQAAALRNDTSLQLDVSTSSGTGQFLVTTAYSELEIDTTGQIKVSPGDSSSFNTYIFNKSYLQFPDLSQQSTAFLGISYYSTTDISEGTNLYFTDERAVSALTSTLSDYLTTSSASSTYLTQSDASSTYLTQSNASLNYQPLDQDLTDISTLTGNGILKKSAGTWGMDDNTYLTSEDVSLSILSDVLITGAPSNGQAIVWSSSASKWVNGTVSGGGGNVVTVSSTTPTSPNIGDGWYDNTDGSYYVYDGTYWVEVTSVITMSDEEAQDKVAPLLDHSNHVNITASYDDANNEIILTSSATPDLSAYLTTSVAEATYQPVGSYLTSESDTLEAVTDRGATSTNAITISNTTQSTTPTSGALIISGGVGIAKDVWIDGDLHVNGSTATLFSRSLSTRDNLIYLNESSPTEITNAVGDGTYVTYTADNDYLPGESIRITGIDPAGYNISSSDLKTIYSATDTEFVVEKTTTGTYVSGGDAYAKSAVNPDLGFAGGYNDGTYAHAGLFRDASDGVFKFFKGYTPEPDEAVNIDTTHASFALANIAVEDLAVNGGDITSSASVVNLFNGLQTINIGNLSDVVPGQQAINIASNRSYPIVNIGNNATASGGQINIGGGFSTSLVDVTISGDVYFPRGFRSTYAEIDDLFLFNPLSYEYGGTGLTTLGTAGQVLTVNSGATGLEWADASSGSSFTNSSELAALLSDETGSGLVVFNDSPTFTGTVTIPNTSIDGQALIQASTGTSSATSTFDTTTHSSAEFIVYASTASGNYVSKVLMLARGTATPVITEYAILTQGTAPTVTITPSYSAPNAVLTVSVTSGTSIKIIATEVSI